MRVKMLIASCDVTYTGHISDYISNNYPDILEICVCNDLQGLRETLSVRRYDVALMDAGFINSAEPGSVKLPLMLWSDTEPEGGFEPGFKTGSEAGYESGIETGSGSGFDVGSETGVKAGFESGFDVGSKSGIDTGSDGISEQLPGVNKYQRISSIVADVLEQYAKISGKRCDPDSKSANITAVWSPAGGVGKTTVALACAASGVTEGKDVFYLNLESFSSVPAFFSERGKSISAVFDMLDDCEGNVKMLLQGISCRESGVTYLCEPDNFDDICILSEENIIELVTSCARITDELIIDLSCICDKNTRQVFELADKVLLVTEPSLPAQAKLSQFISQNNVFEGIREKTTLVANKGAIVNELNIEPMISLPYIQTTDASEVYKTLKGFGLKA